MELRLLLHGSLLSMVSGQTSVLWSSYHLQTPFPLLNRQQVFSLVLSSNLTVTPVTKGIIVNMILKVSATFWNFFPCVVHLSCSVCHCVVFVFMFLCPVFSCLAPPAFNTCFSYSFILVSTTPPVSLSHTLSLYISIILFLFLPSPSHFLWFMPAAL